jgi:hypothetical protein
MRGSQLCASDCQADPAAGIREFHSGRALDYRRILPLAGLVTWQRPDFFQIKNDKNDHSKRNHHKPSTGVFPDLGAQMPFGR